MKSGKEGYYLLLWYGQPSADSIPSEGHKIGLGRKSIKLRWEHVECDPQVGLLVRDVHEREFRSFSKDEGMGIAKKICMVVCI